MCHPHLPRLTGEQKDIMALLKLAHLIRHGWLRDIQSARCTGKASMQSDVVKSAQLAVPHQTSRIDDFTSITQDYQSIENKDFTYDKGNRISDVRSALEQRHVCHTPSDPRTWGTLPFNTWPPDNILCRQTGDA
jgi:hypothetical protein